MRKWAILASVWLACTATLAFGAIAFGHDDDDHDGDVRCEYKKGKLKCEYKDDDKGDDRGGDRGDDRGGDRDDDHDGDRRR